VLLVVVCYLRQPEITDPLRQRFVKSRQRRVLTRYFSGGFFWWLLLGVARQLALAIVRVWRYRLRNSSGSFATLAAIRRASSLVGSLAAHRRPGSSSQWT